MAQDGSHVSVHGPDQSPAITSLLVLVTLLYKTILFAYFLGYAESSLLFGLFSSCGGHGLICFVACGIF